MDDAAPLCLLLLDGILEEVPFGPRAQELNRAAGVVVIEPGRRPPPALLVGRVARRLVRRLPGTPRMIVLVGDAQRHLALALHSEHPGSELWVAGTDFDPEDTTGLWLALEQRGIARR